MMENARSQESGLETNKPLPFHPSTAKAPAHKSFEAGCYKNLHHTRTVQEFINQITNILGEIGFSGFSFAALSPTPSLLFTNLPDGLIQNYKEQDFLKDDFTLSYAQHTLSPIFRSTIEDYMIGAPVQTHDMERNRQLTSLFIQHGFYDFYLIPIQGDGNHFLLSLTTNTKDICDFYNNVKTNEQKLDILAKLVLKIGRIKFDDIFQKAAHEPSYVIYPHPQKLLTTMMKDDLTLRQAAKKLGICIPTADKHIAAAKAAMGVKTTVAAAYQAVIRGLINIK